MVEIPDAEYYIAGRNDTFYHCTVAKKLHPALTIAWGRIKSCTHFALRCRRRFRAPPSFALLSPRPPPLCSGLLSNSCLCPPPPPPPRWLPPNFMHHLTLTATERRHSCATYSDGSLLYTCPCPRPARLLLGYGISDYANGGDR